MHPDTIEALARSHRADLDHEAEHRSLAREARAARSAADVPGDAAGARRGGLGAGSIGHGFSIVDVALRMRRLVRLRA
jgi:hypothetical protein